MICGSAASAAASPGAMKGRPFANDWSPALGDPEKLGSITTVAATTAAEPIRRCIASSDL